MKKSFILFSLVMLMSLGLSAQTMIAAWTFDTLKAAPNTPNVIPANDDLGENAATACIYLDGTNGSSAFASSASSPQLTSFKGDTMGDPRVPQEAVSSALALANMSANGYNVVFKFSTKNFAKIQMAFATRGSSAKAFNSHKWAYSINGTDFVAYDDSVNTADVSANWVLKNLDFSSVTTLDDQEVVYIRLTIDGATSASANNRFDNIVLSGVFTIKDTVAPELRSFEVPTATTMTLKFSEPLDTACVKPANFNILDSAVNVTKAILSDKVVNLTFNALEDAKEYQMVIANITDTAGNVMKEDTITFLFGVSPEFIVTTIADLRKKIDYSTDVNLPDSVVYKLSGDVIVTAKAKYNNQKFIQDSTGAMFIYDPAGVIKTALEIGDKITDLYGTLTNYFGYVEFVPTKDVRFVSSFNEVEPLVVTLNQLKDRDYMKQHQSELVKLENVTFANGGTTFETRKKYDVTRDGVTDNAIYVNFDESDVVGSTIPSEEVNVMGVAFQNYYTEGENKINRYYIIPRMKADITAPTGVISFEKHNISVYPNPATDFVTIETDAQNVVANVFDIYGKLVYTTQIATGYDRINLSSFTSGMYIIRLTSGNEMVGTAKIIKR